MLGSPYLQIVYSQLWLNRVAWTHTAPDSASSEASGGNWSTGLSEVCRSQMHLPASLRNPEVSIPAFVAQHWVLVECHSLQMLCL